jgi:iron complex outermembrane receptor protein
MAFDIPAADSAVDSILQFSAQSGLQVLYDPQVVAPVATRSLQGSYEPDVALSKLLEGTGLKFSETAGHVIGVFRDSTPKPSPVPLGDSPGPEGRNLPTVRIPGWMNPSSASTQAGVTMRLVTADDLAREGLTTIPDWVRTLTQNSGAGANENTRAFSRDAQTNSAYGSGINLYGIGQRATLILVNGQRLAPSGSAGSFTDVANIPVSAIDHIELYSGGTSILFGADAAGGVVNFVLRGSSSAPLAGAAITHFSSGSLAEKDFSQSISRQGDGWRGNLSLEYYSRHELPAADRRQATSNLTPWGGSNFDTLSSNPATILDSTGRVLGVPAGQNGTALSPAQLLPHPNITDLEAGSWVLPHQERLNLVFGATCELPEDSTLSYDALFNRRRIRMLASPVTALLSVPDSNPFYLNPVAGNRSPLNVLYNLGSDLGPLSERGQVDSGQFGLGLNHPLSEAWNLRAYVGYTYERQHDVEEGLANFAALQQYLDSNDPATAFNPFGDGSNTNPSTIKAILANGWLIDFSSLASVNMEAVGKVPSMTAGPMTLTVGYDYRVQSFDSSISPSLSAANLVPTPATNRNRTVSAMFLQDSVPLINTDGWDQRPLALDVSAGLRYEHFSDARAGFTPSVGFDFQPMPGLSLHGSGVRFVRPPNLPDFNEAANLSEIIVLPDPRSETGLTKALAWAGNNSSLRSEMGHSWTLGINLALPSAANWAVQSSYFNIVSSNRIASLPSLPQTVFVDPRYSYLFTRNVTAGMRADVCAHSQFLGAQDQCLESDVGALIDLRLRNAETLRTDGFDISARYGRETPLGAFNANLSATYVLHYKAAETPGSPLIESRNTPHNPTALRLRGLTSLNYHGFSVSPAINFQSSYTDTESIPIRAVSAWMTWDLVLAYEARPLDLPFGGQTVLSLRGYNVFNKQPPFLNNSVSNIGYDPENGNLLGRRVSLAVDLRW